MAGYETALVTGASAGLGEAFARALAARVKRLVLVARREDRLQALAEELRAAHPSLVEVRVRRCDLSSAADVEALVREEIPHLDLLINNAGLGDYGPLATADWEKGARQLGVNVAALTRLTHAALPAMQARGRGGIINVSSLAGELFMPEFAIYAATKAYVSSFSEAVRLEAQPYGVSVVAVCPGPVHTEFGSVAERAGKKRRPIPCYEYLYTSAEQVVDDALTALETGRPRVFPNWRIRTLACLVRWLPRPLLRAFWRLVYMKKAPGKA